jgi:hypothetical protein
MSHNTQLIIKRRELGCWHDVRSQTFIAMQGCQVM